MHVSVLAPTLGGVMIGLSAGALYLLTGRLAGISSILGEGLRLDAGIAGWRWAFLAGLLAGGMVLLFAGGGVFPEAYPLSLPMLIVSGLLVGYGSRLGGGCTSGHGVCGLARLSRRSMAATGLFMASGVLTVFVIRHVLGGP